MKQAFRVEMGSAFIAHTKGGEVKPVSIASSLLCADPATDHEVEGYKARAFDDQVEEWEKPHQAQVRDF